MSEFCYELLLIGSVGRKDCLAGANGLVVWNARLVLELQV